MLGRVAAAAVAMILAAAAATGCGTAAPVAPPATVTEGPAASGLLGVPSPEHVVVVVFENKDPATVIGS
ncbi:MAG TPA: hypothetical protein VIY28_05480, partial [Pseudonocardiaceae bacterium]